MRHQWTVHSTREDLAAQAQHDWAKDHEPPTTTPTFPPLLDQSNVRTILRRAQMADPTLRPILQQLEAAVDSAKALEAASKPLKPVEILQYRLHPLDHVLEKRLIFADGALWVPMLPAEHVPGLVPGVSWRRWAYELVHTTMLHAHRPPGETYQLLRRLGYWKSLVKDLHQWLFECRTCQNHRSQPVQPPMQSITAQDALRSRPPWTDVIIDVQGPYTKAEGG